MLKLKLNKGFTLIEMLLVMVIISIIIFAGINYIQQQTLASRQEKAALQMQQILNAALSYYVVNAQWPASLQCLQGVGGGTCTQRYLPNPLKNPWGQDYVFVAPSVSGRPPVLGFVYTSIVSASGSTTGSAAGSANVISGKLPLSYTTTSAPSGSNPPASGATCGAGTTTCYVVASANVPGQNLNNATAVNFAGLYHHGACVPAPQCPVDANGNTMRPQIFVVPVSVSGVSDQGSNNLYPISSFSAFAIGPTTGQPGGCPNGTNVACTPLSGAAPASKWRVCLQVVTTKGDVAVLRSDAWGREVTLAAFTRCAITNETAGSTFSVFSN